MEEVCEPNSLCDEGRAERSREEVMTTFVVNKSLPSLSSLSHLFPPLPSPPSVPPFPSTLPVYTGTTHSNPPSKYALQTGHEKPFIDRMLGGVGEWVQEVEIHL